uniref:Uncharacterized protein n=1 Tax=Panagrolaimus davidi TaxID=227884 RepID=A0A914Q6Z6_9BILA
MLQIGGSGSKGNDNTNERENIVDEGTKDKYIVKKDDLQEVVNKKDVNVKWTGTKFTMKDLKLQRINTKALQSLGEIYYKRIVISNSDLTQKIPILPDPTTSIGYDKPPLYYDMFQQKFADISATLKTEIAQINEKLLNLENGHGNTKTRLSTLIECSNTAGTCTQLPIAQ